MVSPVRCNCNCSANATTQARPQLAGLLKFVRLGPSVSKSSVEFLPPPKGILTGLGIVPRQRLPVRVGRSCMNGKMQRTWTAKKSRSAVHVAPTCGRERAERRCSGLESHTLLHREFSRRQRLPILRRRQRTAPLVKSTGKEECEGESQGELLGSEREQAVRLGWVSSSSSGVKGKLT